MNQDQKRKNVVEQRAAKKSEKTEKSKDLSGISRRIIDATRV